MTDEQERRLSLAAAPVIARLAAENTFPCVGCGDPVAFSPDTVAGEWFDPAYVTCQFCRYDELPADVRAAKGANAA